VVETADTKAAVREFVDYPYRKYAGDRRWVAPLRIGQFETLDPKVNPFWQHADQRLFLARRGGVVVGRIAYIDDDNHNRIHDENLVFFGFFEADDEEAARALLTAVEQHARERGRDAVRGPLNPTLNDGAGFQLHAFDDAPYVMMPQSPPEYPAWTEAAGYTKVKDLYTFYFDNRGEPAERLAKITARAYKRYPLSIRVANIKNFDAEVATLKRLHESAWEKNWGNVPFTDAEMDHLAKDLKMIVDPDLVIFLEYAGEPIGVAVTIPDINQVLARFNGRLFPTGIFHLLRRKKIINRARLVMLGVVPEYRNKGFDLLLIHEIVVRARANGIVEGECGWTLEDNVAINHGIEAAGGVRNKTYRIYQKQL